MVIQSINEFYTRFLFKIYAITQDVAIPLDISTTFFNNLITNVRELFILEGLQVPQRLTTETNHKGNQRLLLIRNAAVVAEKNTRTIKSVVKKSGEILHHRKFMSMPGVSPSTKTAGLSSSFQSEKNSYTVV